jgi:uncharacterized membrane protein HdeD (DUF308 family)
LLHLEHGQLQAHGRWWKCGALVVAAALAVVVLVQQRAAVVLEVAVAGIYLVCSRFQTCHLLYLSR